MGLDLMSFTLGFVQFTVIGDVILELGLDTFHTLVSIYCNGRFSLELGLDTFHAWFLNSLRYSNEFLIYSSLVNDTLK